ncbi:hypothetical protein [Parasitella parasitica]|uniref:Uncharacterized protein n=1 Tax=Parasitella parasitica TaxID=35722 RepID=A0A0B7NNS8_9FUNG|nr:hypothetical protein [Parasitella parasitica]
MSDQNNNSTLQQKIKKFSKFITTKVKEKRLSKIQNGLEEEEDDEDNEQFQENLIVRRHSSYIHQASRESGTIPPIRSMKQESYHCYHTLPPTPPPPVLSALSPPPRQVRSKTVRTGDDNDNDKIIGITKPCLTRSNTLGHHTPPKRNPPIHHSSYSTTATFSSSSSSFIITSPLSSTSLSSLTSHSLFFVLYSIFNETLDRSAKNHPNSSSQTANSSQKELEMNEITALRKTLDKLIDDHKQLLQKVDEMSKRMTKKHVINERLPKMHTSKVKKLVENIEQTIDHADTLKLGGSVCICYEDLSNTSSKISETTASNDANRIHALEQDIQYLTSRVESLFDKRVSPSELLTKVDLENQMKQYAVIDASNHELKKVVAGLSSANQIFIHFTIRNNQTVSSANFKLKARDEVRIVQHRGQRGWRLILEHLNSKKSSRGKKGDGNIPNFVFKLGGDPPSSPSFTFNGSQPGSPATASPGSFNFTASNPASPATATFNFGASSPASTASQPFVFGDPSANAASPNTSSAFNFNAPNMSSSAATSFGSTPPSIKRHVSEINSLTAQPDRSSSLRRSASEITFGASSVPSTPPTASATPFTFTTPAASPSTSTSAFIFNAPSSTAGSSSTAPAASVAPLNTQNSANSFGSSLSINSSASAPGSASGITFGSNAATSSGDAKTGPASAFGFGTSSSTSTFSFGLTPASTSAATPPVAAASTTSPFSFNKPATLTTAASNEKPATTNTTGFSFGTSMTTPASSASAPQASTSTSTSTGFGGFSFNKPAESPKASTATTSSSTATPTFSFNATAKAADDKSSSTSATPAAAALPSFSFGSTKPSTSTSTTSSTPSTTFSLKPPSTDAAPSSSSTATTSTAPKLTFGGDKDTSKTTVTSSPFTFGTPAVATSSAAASTTTTTTPAITVDPSKPNPFSFEKVLNDLAKAATQPPNQIYASLLTPLAATIQQSQVVNHTSFRIDNIMSTTRFTELPEQAQKELDELEKYIKMESQRCEYIGKQKMPQHLSAMDNAKKNTQILSQQLDALSNTLKVRMSNVEKLYEGVKEQMRHANDGRDVLEVCKHPGNNARWLFGYSDDDDYFSQLARQLNDRVEEYKRCIWEVERTAESWTQNKVQSPQEIADIMRNQNRALISLSSRVASLHETVSNEKNRYYQYLRMYS